MSDIKRPERVKRSISFSKEQDEALVLIASRRNISVSELVREFVEKGFQVDGYKSDEERLGAIIRREMNSVVNSDDFISALRKEANRIVKMQMKVGKVSAGGFFLNLRLLAGVLDFESESQFSRILQGSMGSGIDYMQKRDYDVNDYLQNARELIATALEKKRKD